MKKRPPSTIIMQIKKIKMSLKLRMDSLKKGNILERNPLSQKKVNQKNLKNLKNR